MNPKECWGLNAVKRLSILILVLFGLSAFVFPAASLAQEPKAGETGVGENSGLPEAFFAERDYDAGRVEVGDTVRHKFFVQNLGEADLKILKVTPG